MNSQRTAIHIAKSHNADHTSQNLAISMSLPTLKEMLTKLKETKGMKKAQGTTKAIRNAGNMLNINFLDINKISGKLKIII
ncbi:MAG: hypothetical protein IEMM0006_1938 [bacterium]|nr:MAG: hypothetical protein IEMM0006_1938 [bacterium]